MGRQLLLEAYEDRVAQVANQVFDVYHNKPVTKQALAQSIQARMHGIPLGSLKPQVFVQDVIHELSKRMKISHTPSSTTQAIQQLVPRMVQYVIQQISNQMPDVDVPYLADLTYRKFSTSLDDIFWDSALYKTLDMETWFHKSVYPKVLQQFKKLHGQIVMEYVASVYESHVNGLAHDAAVQGLDVESYLRSHGVSLDNPYK
jgi:hypothetical protein